VVNSCQHSVRALQTVIETLRSGGGGGGSDGGLSLNAQTLGLHITSNEWLQWWCESQSSSNSSSSNSSSSLSPSPTLPLTILTGTGTKITESQRQEYLRKLETLAQQEIERILSSYRESLTQLYELCKALLLTLQNTSFK
jgi:hypothetical protein